MTTELQREKPMYVVLSRGDDTPEVVLDRLRESANLPPVGGDAA